MNISITRVIAALSLAFALSGCVGLGSSSNSGINWDKLSYASSSSCGGDTGIECKAK